MKESELKATLSKGKISSVYLLFGNDPYLVKRYADMISSKAVPEDRELNFISLSENTSVQNIYDAVSQFSFTGGKICAAVSNFNFESCALAEFKKLCEVISNISENNVLILYYDVLLLDAKRSDRMKKLLPIIEQVGGVVSELNHKTENELIKMLCDGAARRSVKMDATTAKHMITNCSDDLNILINELEKLTAYVGKDGVVTAEIVDKVSSKTVEASIYDLSKHILSKKADEALLTLNDLLVNKMDSYIILSVIAGTYVDIYRAKVTISTGVKAESIASEFGYGKNVVFKLTNAARIAKTLNDRQISLILKELLLADFKLKTGIASVVLEELIVKIIKISSTGNGI